MGDLRSQLLKAKLISEEQSQAAKREQRSRHNAQGVRAMQLEADEKAREFREERERAAEKDRQIERMRLESDDTRQGDLRIRQMIESGTVKASSGSQKFYFILDNGQIPHLDLSANAVEDLRNGRVAIVELMESGNVRYLLVNRQTAERLATEKPGCIRFFNRVETS